MPFVLTELVRYNYKYSIYLICGCWLLRNTHHIHTVFGRATTRRDDGSAGGIPVILTPPPPFFFSVVFLVFFALSRISALRPGPGFGTFTKEKEDGEGGGRPTFTSYCGALQVLDGGNGLFSATMIQRQSTVWPRRSRPAQFFDKLPPPPFFFFFTLLYSHWTGPAGIDDVVLAKQREAREDTTL